MRIHEYQAKTLLHQYEIAVPDGRVATTPAEARRIAEEFGHYPVLLKAQIHAGGRGRGGGVRLAFSAHEVDKMAGELLGMTLVTSQTGPRGERVTRILVEKGMAIAQELYLSLQIDRSAATIIILAGTEGGMNVEAVAARSPETIRQVPINPLTGILPFHCRQIAFGLHLPRQAHEDFMALLPQLYRLFVDYDCSLLEVNPLAITKEEELVALDAKIDIDDNSLFRHADIVAMRDAEEEDPFESKAASCGLNYIHLSGNVGTIANGAGLAMATMDLIKQAGAEPANFLDVGGGASVEKVEKGFSIIMGDAKVKAILVNIFGGILRCDVLADGVVRAARQVGLKVPVVVRMEGTNVAEGRRLLAESGLPLIMVDDLQAAAGKIAGIIRG
jgi:succinyl-CoA synthetase beta subunit